MANFKFRGNIAKALYEGYSPQQIYKEIKKEYAVFRKTLNKTIIDAKQYNEDIKKDILPILNNSKKLQQKDLRYLNPAREQLKQLNKIKIKNEYKKPVLVYRANDAGKLIVPDYDWIKTVKTKSQQKTLISFRESYKKNVQREIRRFNNYGKALNLNQMTLKIKGIDMSLTEIYNNYLKTNDKNLKSVLRKKLNFGFSQIKKINVSKHKNSTKRIYSGDLESVKEGNIENPKHNETNFHTVDINNNVFGWLLNYSAELVLEGELEQRGSGIIIWESHYEQLQSQGMDLNNTIFLTLWRRLKYNNI